MNREKYKTAQSAWIEMVNLKAGDEVMVVCDAKTHENGWHNSWELEMTENVGKTFKVSATFDREYAGINLMDSARNSYPFFVLKKIPKKLPENIKIFTNYDVVFKEDRSIEVGCQKIPFDLFEKIYNTAKSIQ